MNFNKLMLSELITRVTTHMVQQMQCKDLL